jgi:hypothetical protein
MFSLCYRAPDLTAKMTPGLRLFCVDNVLRGIRGRGNGALPPRLLRRYAKVNRLFASLADFNGRLS